MACVPCCSFEPFVRPPGLFLEALAAFEFCALNVGTIIALTTLSPTLSLYLSLSLSLSTHTHIRRQWWSKNNPLGAKTPRGTPVEGSEAEGKDKEPKAPNATPEDSEADKREEDRFRDIIERWCYLAP